MYTVIWLWCVCLICCYGSLKGLWFSNDSAVLGSSLFVFFVLDKFSHLFWPLSTDSWAFFCTEREHLWVESLFWMSLSAIQPVIGLGCCKLPGIVLHCPHFVRCRGRPNKQFLESCPDLRLWECSRLQVGRAAELQVPYCLGLNFTVVFKSQPEINSLFQHMRIFSLELVSPICSFIPIK